jgi:1,4-dihydroxy-2-naphthoate octaprenyltransferase
MVGGTYYVCTGEWSHSAAVLGLLYGIGPTTVLFGKHIDKLELDRDKGVRTLPVLLGQQTARRTTQLLMLSQYLGCIALVLSGREPWTLGIVLLSLPALVKALRALQRDKPVERPETYPAQLWPLWFSAKAFGLTRQFTSLFIAALLIGIWL